MKLEDAKKKACPFDVAPNCIGEECIAWEFKYVRIGEYNGHIAFTTKSETEGDCRRLKK